MDEPKRPCNCWLDVGSCYCEEDELLNTRKMSKFIKSLIRDTDVDFNDYKIKKFKVASKAKVANRKDKFLITQLQYNGTL